MLVCALAVPALGLVAFWLYSLALSRTGVAAATGALIVLQTFVPAASGSPSSATVSATAGGRRSRPGCCSGWAGRWP